MKVFYVASILPSYRDDFMAGLNKELAKNDIELEVLCGTPLTKKVIFQSQHNDFVLRKYQSYGGKALIFRYVKTPMLYEYFQANRPDAVVVLYNPNNITMLRIVNACLKSNIPYATWRCGWQRKYSFLTGFFRSRLLARVERRAALNITYGSVYKSVLLQKGIPDSHIIVAQNTIDVERILQHTKHRKKEFSDDTTKVLFVGALIPGKQLMSSVKVVEKLAKEGYKIKFTIVGGGEAYDELKAYIQQNTLDKVVELTGPKTRDEVAAYFLNADVFLLAGTGGLAVNEAMAYGLPIISTDADWTVSDLLDGNGYFMDKYGDVDQQYLYLKSFLSLSADEKEKMSQRSLELIEKRASLRNMIEKHKQACFMLLNRNV